MAKFAERSIHSPRMTSNQILSSKYSTCATLVLSKYRSLLIHAKRSCTHSAQMSDVACTLDQNGCVAAHLMADVTGEVPLHLPATLM